MAVFYGDPPTPTPGENLPQIQRPGTAENPMRRDIGTSARGPALNFVPTPNIAVPAPALKDNPLGRRVPAGDPRWQEVAAAGLRAGLLPYVEQLNSCAPGERRNAAITLLEKVVTETYHSFVKNGNVNEESATDFFEALAEAMTPESLNMVGPVITSHLSNFDRNLAERLYEATTDEVIIGDEAARNRILQILHTAVANRVQVIRRTALPALPTLRLSPPTTPLGARILSESPQPEHAPLPSLLRLEGAGVNDGRIPRGGIAPNINPADDDL
jgi:hypothetical protein